MRAFRVCFSMIAALAVASFASGQITPRDNSNSAHEGSEISGSGADTIDLLPALPPPPGGRASLVGGTITDLDRVRDQVTVEAFRGPKMTALFDARTLVFRDGKKASQQELKKGERVYLDTVLDGTTVFARSIRIHTGASAGEIRGQVVKYDPATGSLDVRDALTPNSVKLQLNGGTSVVRGAEPASARELRPGSLVHVQFQPAHEGRALVREISILAAPGTGFTFSGEVVHIDLHSGLIVLVDAQSKKSYEIHFDPARMRVGRDLQRGADVTVTADFDGMRYLAKSIVVDSQSPK